MDTRMEIIGGLAAIALLVGCGTKESEPAPASSAGTASTSRPAPSSGPTVTVTGSVHFDGPAPERKPIQMAGDMSCAQAHSGPVLAENLIVSPGGGLQNAFVYVKSGLEGRTFATPTTAAVLDQHGCMYRPRVMGVQIGQEIRILNSDPTLHNVHALPKKGEFNVGMPRQGMEIVRKFSEPEVMVHFKCDVHPWMSAWVGVLPHPYFAVSDSTGAFSIADLPPGTYAVEVWHEKLGTQDRTITVGDHPSATLDFTLRPAP